jgi:hypothetical protein
MVTFYPLELSTPSGTRPISTGEDAAQSLLIARLAENAFLKRNGSEAPVSELPPTIWYMGAKTRVLQGFLAEVLSDEAPTGATVFDLFSGTAIVSAFSARRFRTLANDVQRYCQVIAASFIEHDPATREAFLESLSFERDLLAAYQRNRTALGRIYQAALAKERECLDRIQELSAGRKRRGDAWRRAIGEYRRFLLVPGGLYEALDGAEPPRSALYADAALLVSEASIRQYREDPGRWPRCLITAYYANVYFGLRQSIEIDSLRAAIAAIGAGAGGDAALASRKRTHYLSALLHAASVSTSGTSHFAQPRHIAKDSEVAAMARRRGIDIVQSFLEFSREIRDLVASTEYRHGNRAYCADYRDFIEGDDKAAGGGNRVLKFRDDVRADLVYMDPPYTSDNYSRFYHVLEVLVSDDYPFLERGADGRTLRGRYPEIRSRFQSNFCRAAAVEGEFERVIRAAAGSGAKLIISYGSPNGLLLKHYRRRTPRRDPVDGLEGLCRRAYGKVRVLKRQLLHSGQGDSMLPTDELLVVCTEPR